MKIVVCVKQVVDVSFHFEIDPEACRILPQDVFYVMNPADGCACELAVQAKETMGGEVIAISFGPSRVRLALRSCLAMGANRAIHIWDERDDADLIAVAYLLAEAIRPLAPDMVMCGSRSEDEMSGQVPAALAEFMDIPQATGVVSMDLTSAPSGVVVQRRLEGGRRERLLCPLPALISVEPGIVQVRYPSFPDLLSAYEAEIEQITPQELGCHQTTPPGMVSAREILGWSLPRPRPKKTFSMDFGLSAEQRMELLMSGGVRQTKSDLLEGDPEELARKLADILLQRPWERR